MNKLIVANWKANLSLTRAESWLAEVQAGFQPVEGLRIVVAVPFPFLISLQRQFSDLPWIRWAAQDVSPFPLGNYTGSVPAAWLAGLVDLVIVGHRERRRYFHETVQDVANKMSEALDEDIRPVLCVDMENARRQAAAAGSEDFANIIVAYTPDDAEQLEIARGRKDLEDEIKRVASIFPGASVLYGGGVDEKNVAGLLAVPEIEGVMVARGCLDPQAFISLLRRAAESLGG